MELTDKVKASVAAGLVAMTLAVLGLWAGRTYERHTAEQKYEEALKEKDTKLTQTTDTLAQALVEKGKLYTQIEQMKKTAKTWDRGNEYTDAQGIVHKIWDRGTDDSEEVVNSLQEQLQETNISLKQSQEANVVSLSEVNRLHTELFKTESLVKKASEFRGIMAFYDLDGKPWQDALDLKGMGSVGTVLYGLGLRPGGPFKAPELPKDAGAWMGALSPSVGLGLRF